MTKLLKNIRDGIGSVLVEIPSAPEYRTISRDGFGRDAANLKTDSRRIVRALNGKVMEHKLK